MVTFNEILGLSIMAFCAIVLLTLNTFLNNKKVNDITSCLLDIFPILILLFVPINLNTLVWVIGITLAYNIIESNQIIGIILYLLVYGFVGFVAYTNNFDYKYLFISILVVLALLTLFSIIFNKQVTSMKLNVAFVVLVVFYVTISFLSLIYTFLVTNNYAFLLLVISDILIGCNYVLTNTTEKNLNRDKILSYIILLTFDVGAIISSISIPYIN